jgi:hypothetical protein
MLHELADTEHIRRTTWPKISANPTGFPEISESVFLV